MRVVIIGATGNVGTSLVEALAADPEITTIVGIARRRPRWSPVKTRWVEADIRHDELSPHFRGADAVVHLAWMLQPTHRPLTTWKTNVYGTRRVLDAVEAARVPTFVYASSVGAYSPGPKDRFVDEIWPTDGWPTAAYCREKAYVERMLDTFALRLIDRRVVRLRPAFVFKRTSAASQRRIFIGPLLPSPLVQPDMIPVFPDFEGLRLQVLHGADVAEAYRLAIHKPVSGAFNLAADPVIDAASLQALLDARPVRVPTRLVRMVIAAGWHARLLPSSPYLFDAAMHLPLMDTRRAREELGWEPQYSSLEALSDFLEGMRTETGMETPPLVPSQRSRVLPATASHREASARS